MIVLNELEYAERCIRDSHIDKPYFTLSILAKYYHYHRGYSSDDNIAELKDFLSNNYPKYKLERKYWDDVIEKLVGRVDKYTLYEIEGVWITENELATIEKINNDVLERIAFTLLCLAKLANARNEKSNGWVNESAKDIYTLARVSATTVEKYELLGDLYELGLIELPKRNDILSYRVTFIDDKSKNELFIHDFRELGYEYLKYKGQNIIRCAECGKLTRGNKAGTKRYCSSCAGYTPQKTKAATCVDCGKEFHIDAMNTKTTRCCDCQRKFRNKYQRDLMRERRKSKC